MWSFLREFSRSAGQVFTVLVMDEDQMEEPRRYRIVPRNVLLLLLGGSGVLTFLLVGLVILTPLRELIPGYGTAEVRRQARLNAMRLTALQDSLAVQQEYIRQFRYLVTGYPDSIQAEARPAAAMGNEAVVDGASEPEGLPLSANWSDHAQPAIPLARLALPEAGVLPVSAAADRYLSSIPFPVQPPVNGFLTRGFDARIGHYAVDLAVTSGTPVHAIGDGYVVLTDWTQEGGHAIVVQHAGGFLSAYKHNDQILKRVGDRVRDREIIARSGNSGEITTGPHLHFELWLNGLAQDPRYYFAGY